MRDANAPLPILHPPRVAAFNIPLRLYGLARKNHVFSEFVTAQPTILRVIIFHELFFRAFKDEPVLLMPPPPFGLCRMNE